MPGSREEKDMGKKEKKKKKNTIGKVIIIDLALGTHRPYFMHVLCICG